LGQEDEQVLGGSPLSYLKKKYVAKCGYRGTVEKLKCRQADVGTQIGKIVTEKMIDVLSVDAVLVPT
jgi:hypothetical protein